MAADWFDDASIRYLETLPENRPDITWVWQEIDRVWSQLGLNNRLPLDVQAVDDFYHHPVWIMNGIFTAVDPESIGHRRAISAYVHGLPGSRVADYGGGFGELARTLANTDDGVEVVVIEPYPSTALERRLAKIEGVRLSHHAQPRSSDVVIAQDVLEHVEEPVEMAIELAEYVFPGGHAIFANAFWPFIECHLPRTFHLRHTFRFVMQALGLKFVGSVPGAEHALVFQVPAYIHPDRARSAAHLSRVFGPGINLARDSIPGRLKQATHGHSS